MSSFLLGLVLGLLINLVTALFSREKALKLIPWMTFYLLLHGTYAVLSFPSVNSYLVMKAKIFPNWLSYTLVMLIGAVLAAVYWYGAQHIARSLDLTTAVSQSASHEDATRDGSVHLSADQIAEAIQRRSEPPLNEKARRYRLRKDLTQYLAWGSAERDTFRLLLQPTRDEKGRRVDSMPRLGASALRIQAWRTELITYVNGRLGNDYALWLMSSTHSQGDPGGVGNVPGLAHTWDNVASGVEKIEQLLREFPELPGGAEAAETIESQWLSADGTIDWSQQRLNDGQLRVSLRCSKDRRNPIVRIVLSAANDGMPRFDYEELPLSIGNRKFASANVFHFEVFGTWVGNRGLLITFPTTKALTVEKVEFRLW